MRLNAPFLHFSLLINVFDFESSEGEDDDNDDGDENVTIQKEAKNINAEYNISSMKWL